MIIHQSYELDDKQFHPSGIQSKVGKVIIIWYCIISYGIIVLIYIWSVVS